MIIILLFLFIQNYKSHRTYLEGEQITLESNLPLWVLDGTFEEEQHDHEMQRGEETLMRLRADSRRAHNRLLVIEILMSELQDQRLTPDWVCEDGIQDDMLDSLAERLLDDSGEVIQEAVDAWREELIHAGDGTNDGDDIENASNGNIETDEILDGSEATDERYERNHFELFNECNLEYI